MALGLAIARATARVYAIDSAGFMGYQVIPWLWAGACLMLSLLWAFRQYPPRRMSLTFAAAAAVHGILGFAFFPQSYSLLVVPIVSWAALLGMLLRRLDWVGPPPLAWGSWRNPKVIYLSPIAEDAQPAVAPSAPSTPPASSAPPAVAGFSKQAASSLSRPDTIAIRERFDRLREELKPCEEARPGLSPSPIFLGILALILGVLSIFLLLPGTPSTVALYGQQTDWFEAEPLWDPLLLRPASHPPLLGTTSSVHTDRWRPQPRMEEIPDAWSNTLQCHGLRVLFSKRSALVRLESSDLSANVNPLMEFPDLSADGFAMLPWNRGSLSSGAATGWQEWRLGEWSACVRYSGDPWVSGSWPVRARQGLGPWLGKVAVQLLPNCQAAVLTSVNRLYLELSGKQADLCSLAVEPLHNARVSWGLSPTQITEIREGEKAILQRAYAGFSLWVFSGASREAATDKAASLEKISGGPAQTGQLLREHSSDFDAWMIVRDASGGAGFLLYCPFWQRQVGVERGESPPMRRPGNQISLSLKENVAQIRWSLLAPCDTTGAAVAGIAPGTYLNSLVIVPVPSSMTDEEALSELRHILAVHAPQLLRGELDISEQGTEQ